MKNSQRKIIRALAIFKFAKASLLLVAGVELFRLVGDSPNAQLSQLVTRLGISPDDRHVQIVLRRVGEVPEGRIKGLGLGSFLCATLFLMEGIGLWSGRRWGEWSTVIITGSLIPLEVFEICHHPSVIKVLLTILNIAVVSYLGHRIRQEDRGLCPDSDSS